jgi:hypothetical protein
VKCLDILYAARDQDSVGTNVPTIAEERKAGVTNQDYHRFRDCLSVHLSQQAQTDIRKAKRVIDEATPAHMKRLYSFHPLNALVNGAADILDSSGLPDWMDKGMRSLYRKLFPAKPLLFQDVPPPPEYQDDFNRIRSYVIAYIREFTHD